MPSPPKIIGLNTLRVVSFSLLGLLVAFGVAQTDLGKRMDWLAYDLFFRARHLQGMDPAVDPRLLIVEIDEDTRQQITEPLALWVPRYGEVLGHIFESGAQLVGFDIIPTYAPVDRLKLFLAALGDHVDQLLMVTFYDTETHRLVTPESKISQIVGENNLGLSNLSRDEDGIFRRQSLSDYSYTLRDGSSATYPFITRLLYERITGDETPPDEVLINFAGPPGSIPRVSFGRVVDWIESGNAEQMKNTFDGKVVLIGGTARVDLDFVETPYPSIQPMPGVEMHANILNTLLTRQYLKPQNLWWLLGLLLLPLAWTALERPVSQSLRTLCYLTVGWLAAGYILFLNLVVVTPTAVALIGLLSTYLGSYLYRFNTVEREQRRIQYTFGRYVSQDVMEAMLEVPGDHRPELARRQRVTVMFSDINNFSTACEVLEPEEVTRRLNNYFSEMTNILFDHQGTIIRFIGDEFMVLFGAPRRIDKHEELAVLAAVRMVRRLEELKAQDPKGENGFYEVKIGIHVGDMILTSIGNEIRSDYNCIGDATNMAARVLSLTKPLGGTVLISEEVKSRVEANPVLEFRDLGTHPVKGRAGEVRVYDVTLRSDAS